MTEKSKQRLKYRAAMPDTFSWKRNVACRVACPVQTDARAYVNAIARGSDLDAYRIARANNPFASICGRICEAPCEDACTRINIDSPVTIRALKRFVTEQFGPESPNGPDGSLVVSGHRKPKPNGFRVAIVGAGCAGLSASHDLARIGYDCTLFEEENAAGGRLARVPEDLLPAEIIGKEIETILAFGISLKTGVSLGTDFNVDGLLEEGFNAVCIAVGADCREKSMTAAYTLPVFLCGEVRLGPAMIIEAIADGQRVASEVHSYLTGACPRIITTTCMTSIGCSDGAPRGMKIKRELPPGLPVNGGPMMSRECSYAEMMARDQASRCLNCNINPIFNSELCNLCGDCVEVCPTDALIMTPISDTEIISTAVNDRSVEFVAAVPPGQDAKMILIDPGMCVRCGLCAKVCPKDAITMKVFDFEEDIVYDHR